MATEGTREGGSSMNRGQGKYFDREKRPGGGTRFQKSDRSGAPRGDRQAGGDRPPRGNGNRSYGEKSYGDRPYGDRPPRNERPNRNYGGAPKFPKKDEDEEDRGRRSKPSRPKESKPTIAIPDKNKVQKKQNNKKRESSRPQPKQKRSSNINYTKNYANGAYDDYEDFDDWE